jgi:hypothetical protein
MSRLQKKAIEAINTKGILLVYPIDNRPLPDSLWSELFPKTKMRWEWDDDGDSRVADLWHLRTILSESRQVVYSKWYQNRATFFSRPVWSALYRLSREWKPIQWRPESDEILETLDSDSPLSTKQLKEAVGLQGRLLESTYEKSLRPLWQHFDIVGFGEFEDSSFPSLAVGSTRVLFEDLVQEAEKLTLAQARTAFERFLPEKSLWLKFWKRISAAPQSPSRR